MSAGREQEPSADAPTFLVASTVFGQRFEERYFRQPVPLHFPVEEEMPETKRHLELRTLLYQVLKLAFADRAAIGCDQFVYWDPTDPRACLAPDGFVRLGEPDHLFDTWMVWEHGAPQVAIEIGSRSDRPEPRWEDKLEKYRRLGVVELIRFEPEAAQRPLRIWGQRRSRAGRARAHRRGRAQPCRGRNGARARARGSTRRAPPIVEQLQSVTRNIHCNF